MKLILSVLSHFMKHFIYRLLLALLPIAFYTGCTKVDPDDVVPNVYVSERININEPSSIDLIPYGGWMYTHGGYNGLVIYRSDQYNFICYDRQSPYQVSNRCQVSANESGFLLIDTCSASEYSMFEGYVTKGPSKTPLTQYKTTFDGTYIYIRNY